MRWVVVSSRVSWNIMTAQVNTRAGHLPYQRGSEWRKWDLHIHTPGTAREDIQICQSRESGGLRWNRTSLVSIKKRVHLPSLPVTHVHNQSGAGCWNRTNASRLSTACSTFELFLHGAPFGS